MTSIYKTAYPYYSEKKKIDDEIIIKDYALTREEISLIKKDMPDGESQLNYAVLLVVFKNLNYFPEVADIPNEIIKYVKEQLQTPDAQFNWCHPSTTTRHKKRIYKYLGITPWKEKKETDNKIICPVKEFAEKSAIEASKLHNYPADIINVVTEALKQKHFEFPTFKQLDRLVRHARELVNKTLFDDVYSSLIEEKITTLDKLLDTPDDYQRSGYNDLKALPKNPTISHFRELLKHHDWLMSFGEMNHHLKNIIPVKLNQFSEQARTSDASNMRDFERSKRYTLMLCLINQLQSRAKDSLAITFCKTIFGMHKKSKEKLENLREYYRKRTQELLCIFSDVLDVIDNHKSAQKTIKRIQETMSSEGGAKLLKIDCDHAVALNSNNHLPFLLDFYRGKRETLLHLLETLDLRSSTQDDALLKAIQFILSKKEEKLEYISEKVNLSFTTDTWKKLITKTDDGNNKKTLFHHLYLEMCVLSHVASELRSKDLFVVGSDAYNDHRKELLSWTTCANLLDDYCKKTNIPNSGKECVRQLKERLENKAKSVDDAYPSIAELSIDKDGIPTLHKREAKKKPKTAAWLDKTIKLRMKERNLIDILCSSHFYCGWASVFGPISGDNPKIKNAVERYILTCFAYATRLGPTQTAQHVKDSVSAHMLSWINRRHVTPEILDLAREKLINLLKQFKLTKSWGDGTSVSGDGTMQELREQSLIADFHFRYRKKGGISYHHVADNYILLFSTFMSCGVWEAVEIIEGLLKNSSDVQPDIIHGDTQAQSTVIFALAYLLGFRLMPRIRNWKDLKLFRPSKQSTYKNIDALFNDTINWDLIENHWEDVMQVVLSIKKGKMSSSKLLRKLSTYSKKNRLYQAFQELGYVIRTLFLLDYISDVELRETITARTNKVESYNAFSDFCSFGSEILVASNDDREMEKAVKYNDILTNAVILQNVSDMTEIIAELKDEGHAIAKDDMSYLCPYITEHLKRFGDIVMDFNGIPKSVESSRRKVLW
ncbi:MAG: Tn3 family transposase [Gammaproteobacteria bacterium]|nr:Tn3 family transposase [Gammaproteobacteria bacterium]